MSWVSFFGRSADDLPATIEPLKRGKDVNLEIFIDGAITKIYNEASARSKDQRQIKEACKKLLDTLRSEDATTTFKLSMPLGEKEVEEVLTPLRLACASKIPRLQEPALGCIHKLVAHSYLQGESGSAGRLDEKSMVANVVTMVYKCGENNNEAVQLAVIRGLLTIVTADHFVLHGDCLMQAVRTVFNVAVGSESVEMQRTAKNSLLQMLNTVLKRVTSPLHFRTFSMSMSSLYSPSSSRPVTPATHDLTTRISNASNGSLELAMEQAAAQHGSRHEVQVLQLDKDNEKENDSPAGGEVAAASTPRDAVGDAAAGASGDQSAEVEAQAGGPGAEPWTLVPAEGGNGDAQEGGNVAVEPAAEAAVEPAAEPATVLVAQQPITTPFASSSISQDIDTAAVNGVLHKATGTASQGPAVGTEHVHSAEMRAATLASLAEQVDIRGLEKALEKDAPPMLEPTIHATKPPTTADSSSSGKESGRRALMRDRLPKWKHLTVLERDVLLVLTAICKMAARETAGTTTDAFLLKGKLLALDLLVRVLRNPHHHWEPVRTEFCDQLRQPLCLALLRNCTSSHPEVCALSCRLLTLVMHQQKLRAGLKAELGALFPLLLLRPVEAERPDINQLMPALEALQVLCSDPQLLVDLFVNFDCSLQAANLYERTMKALCKIIKGLEPSPQLPQASVNSCKEAALRAVQAAVGSLDAWAGPLKDATSAAVSAAQDPVDAADGSTVPPAASSSQHVHGSTSIGDASEVERFGAVKEKKDSLQAAIALFNRKPLQGVKQLIASGLVADDVASIAKFLRESAASLDKTMVGEYLGHHEQKEIDVMHAYIDLDRYEGLTIDNGLRQLLGAFRLPGESQKIDRIMEKFAERYCKDNPHVFRTAGDAYILSFAIIMLNTDAHNPMAEQRLTCEDFINMNQSQDEDGSYHPILPAEDIEGIFNRITTNEIQTHDDKDNRPSTAQRQAQGKQTASIMKLAAALGITQVMLPFRGGAVWDKQHGVDVERKWLLEKTRELVAQGSSAGVMWHSASHSEHARPMMQVSGDVLMRAFVAAFHQASDIQTATDVLNAFALGIRLTGILGLYSLCETMTAALAAETGVSDPAPQGSLKEQKQVAALNSLLSIASGFEGGLLGTSWLIILRVLSQLNSLQAKLLVSADGQPAIENGLYRERSLIASARQQRIHEQGGVMRLMSSMVAPDGPAEQPSDDEETDSSLDVEEPEAEKVAVSVLDGPGHALVEWSVNAGEEVIFSVYLRSVSLDGDAVVAFFRALCAVSQEEIQVSGKPRIYSLKKLVECAHVNMGRIRLVLSRVWLVVAPHLVSAACHPDTQLAKLAVECLRQLITKLLIRAELANFTYQDEALRPFVLVLRHCDGPDIREFAARSISSAISAHPRGLGSGWRSLLAALTIAAGDDNERVVAQALESLQPVVAALYLRSAGGHEYLKECVTAVLSAVNNSKHEDLSIKALSVMRAVAGRLASATPVPAKFPPSSSSATVPATPEEAALPRRHSEPQPHSPTSSSNSGGWASRSRVPSAEESSEDSRKAVASTCGASLYEAEWAELVGCLARIARLEVRARVADAAGQCMVDVLRDYSASFDNKTWQVVFSCSVHVLFYVPANTRYMTRSSSPNGENSSGHAEKGLLAAEGLERLERQSKELLRQLWDVVARQYNKRGPRVLQQCLQLCVSYIMCAQQTIALLGVVQLKGLVDRMGSVVDAAGWREVVHSLSLASSTDHLLNELDPVLQGASDTEAKAIADRLRCRCALVVSMQRLIGEVHSRWQLFMPGEVQLQTMSILKDTVDRALEFNQDNVKRTSTLMLLSARIRHSTKNSKFQLSHSGDLGHLTLAAGAGGRHSHSGAGHSTDSEEPSVHSEAADGESSVIDRLGNVSTSGGDQDSDFGFEKIERPGYAPVAQDLFVPDVLRPALLRQEVEGGLLLLTCLLSTMEHRRKKMASEGPNGESAMVFGKAQQQLLMVCRRLISVATDDVLEGESSVGAVGIVGDSSWDTAIRAPLTVSALRAYLSVEVGAMKGEVKDVFQDLTTLMRSPDMTVRREVEAVFDGRIYQILLESGRRA